jgi:hypothetical protein
LPEGFLGLSRLTNYGPISRQTKEEVKSRWDDCKGTDKEVELCKSIKTNAILILEKQGVFAEFDSLRDINSGKCFTLARRVSKELDYVNRVKLKTGDHCWLEYKGKHYDAESPNGVSDPLELEFFKLLPADFILENAEMDPNVEEKPESIQDLIVYTD